MPKRRRPTSFDASRMGQAKRRRQAAARRRALTPLANIRTGGFIGRELKFADKEVSAQAFSGSWGTLDPTDDSLTGVAQGNGESQRLGRKYSVHSLHLKGFIEAATTESQTAPLQDILCRLVVVLDTQTNAAQVTATDVFDAGQTDDINSFRNLQHSTRFRVLKDKTFKINRSMANLNEGAANLFATPSQEIPFKWNFKFKDPIEIITTGTTAAINVVATNSIHVIGIATSTAGLINYQSRLRYTG